jgi:hypothetical protein
MGVLLRFSGRRIPSGIAGLLAVCAAIAACGSSGSTYTAPSGLSKCAVTVDASGTPLPASGGSGSLSVKTERECQWTAQPDVNWLSITAGSNGQGDGTVQFSAGANGDPVARTGTITLNGQRAAITQAAAECRYDLSQNAAAFPQAGGSGSVDVRASSALCTWTASSDADWIAITGAGTGKGSAPVGFTVASTTGPPRTGTLTIAGLHFSVTQAEGCSYSIAPTTYAAGAGGGGGVVTVTSGVGCPWTAASNAPWITVTAGATGTGNGTAGFTVDATSGPSRTGSITIAGQMFTVTQSPGCSYDVSPLAESVDASGGTRTVNVNAASGCGWTAASNQSWIIVTNGTAGSGPGVVTLAIAATTGTSRSGTVTIAGQTVTISQGQGCTFNIEPDSQSVPSSGGSGSVSVTAAAGCAWTAKSNESWIAIGSGGSGAGNGTVNYSVAATTGPARSGTLTVAGRTFTVNQGEGCTAALSSANASVPASGGSGTFDVNTAGGCGWSASSNASWITISSGASGTGKGTVHYAAAANTGAQRTGTITAAGQTFTIAQDGGCTFAIAPSSQDVGSSGTGGTPISVAVTGAAGCTWTAASNALWIHLSSGSGSGNGTLQVVVDPSTEASRTGTATIAGQTFTVNQSSGCTLTLSAPGQSVPAAGGSGSFNVMGSGSCSWTAAANAPWITITSGASGSGNGTVQFSAAPNTGAARSGTITAAGQTFTVTQDAGCTFGVAPDTIGVPAAGGPQNISVTAAAECAWTAAANAPWLAVTSGASGAGNGTVQLDVQPNAGAPRSGTATVAGRTITFNQEGGCTFAIAPAGQPVGVGGGSGSVAVTASDSCAWTAVSNVPWITITAGSNGAGSGTVQFTVDANATGAPRSGTLTIAGQTFTVMQAGA